MSVESSAVKIETEAVYENGTLRLLRPVPLHDQQRVTVMITPVDLLVPESVTKEVSIDEFTRLLDELAFDDELPTLPADFSRADIYADHD